MLGVSEERTRITLYRCTGIGEGSGMPGPTKSTYRARAAILGAHVESVNDFRFAYWATCFSNFAEWVGVSGMDVEHPAVTEVVVRYRRPDEIDMGTVGELGLRVEFGWSFSHGGIGSHDVQLTEEPHVRIDAPGGRTVEDLLPVQRKLQDFLTIAMAEPVFPTSVNALLVSQPHNPVDVYYALPRAPATPRSIVPGDMLFTRADLGDALPERVQRWFARTELDPIYALYFGTLYNPLAYQEQRFLAFAQAIESYHRRTMNHPVMAKVDFKRLRDAVLTPLSGELRRWVMARCGFMNEPTLRQRLDELFALFDAVTRTFPFERDAFVDDVIVARNYYTHYTDALRERAATGANLARLTQKLRVLLAICFLHELGFPHDEIARLIARNRSYQFDLGAISG